MIYGCLTLACSSSKKPEHGDGAAAADGGLAGAAGGATGGRGGSAGGAAAGTGGNSTGAGGAGVAGGAGQGGVPTVVATLDAVPISLALAGDRLYVTLVATQANTGKVVSVAKTATNASADGGTAVTTLASGLAQPGAIAVNGNQVLWADTDRTFPDPGALMSVSLTGGSVSELLSYVAFYVSLPIANSVLYALTSDNEDISAYVLGATDGGAGDGKTVYPGNPPNGVTTVDSDGTSVFFLTPNANATGGIDLYKIPVAGGTPTDLAMNASTGSSDYDYIIHDDTTVYWSDSGTGSVFSVPKAGGTTKTLETFPTGSAPVQIVLDGDNIYALWGKKLVRFPKVGGTPVVLASLSSGGSADSYEGQGLNAIALAVDDTFVYWLYGGAQQIVKIAK